MALKFMRIVTGLLQAQKRRAGIGLEQFLHFFRS